MTTRVEIGDWMAQEESLWAGGDELYAWNKVWKFRDCFGSFLKVWCEGGCERYAIRSNYRN